MIDRQPTHAGRVQLAPVAGQTNIYDMSMADGATEQGTPLNKANLLKDATAALYGLTSAAVPDDVFAWLGKFNEYAWRRRSITTTESKVNLASEALIWQSNVTGRIQYSQIVEIANDGGVKLVNPLSFTNNDDLSTVRDGLITASPCYIQTYISENVGKTFYLPQGATFNNFRSTISSYSVLSLSVYSTNPNKTVTLIASPTGEWDVVYATDRDAYPDSGYADGYEYEYLFRPYDNLTSVHTKIETGSYVGTGTYGVSNPNSLTFSFAPKLVWIYSIKAGGGFTPTDSVGQNANPIIPVDTMQTSYTSGFGFYASGGSSYSWGKVANDKKTISWYSTSTAAYQLNISNTTYSYIAIG